MRRSIRWFAISAMIVLTTESSYAVQRGQATAQPAQPPSRAAVVKTAPAKAVTKTSRTAKPVKLSPVQQKLQRNVVLATKIRGQLPAGTNLMTAASGFRTVTHFVAAVNVSNSTQIPFAELKRRMAYDGMTLGQAIQDVRPKSDYRLQAHRAETEAAALVGTEDVEALPAHRAQRAP